MKDLHTLLDNWPLTHHAYVIESSHSLVPSITKAIKDHDVSYIYEKEFDTMKIDDARTIKELQRERTEKASVFIIYAAVINIQVQNALLKVFEEPTPNTYFIIIVPQVKALLVTLQSRLEQVSGISTEKENTSVIGFELLISSSLSKRFELIKKYTDVKAGDERITKQQAYQLFDGIEVYYTKKESSSEFRDLFEALNTARQLLAKNGASIKMILDLVAVNLP